MSDPQNPRRSYLLGVNDKKLLKRLRIGQDDATTRSSTSESAEDADGARDR